MRMLVDEVDSLGMEKIHQVILWLLRKQYGQLGVARLNVPYEVLQLTYGYVDFIATIGAPYCIQFMRGGVV
jgi:hypothetical protein